MEHLANRQKVQFHIVVFSQPSLKNDVVKGFAEGSFPTPESLTSI
jgi:hypothetical protein